MSEWLKPTESLPENDNAVLVMGGKDGAAVPTTAVFFPTFGWVNRWTGEPISVKCWMPLPEPPKED